MIGPVLLICLVEMPLEIVPFLHFLVVNKHFFEGGIVQVLAIGVGELSILALGFVLRMNLSGLPINDRDGEDSRLLHDDAIVTILTGGRLFFDGFRLLRGRGLGWLLWDDGYRYGVLHLHLNDLVDLGGLRPLLLIDGDLRDEPGRGGQLLLGLFNPLVLVFRPDLFLSWQHYLHQSAFKEYRGG